MICKWKEDKADGRGIYTGADGTCLVVPLRPNSLVGNPPHKCHIEHPLCSTGRRYDGDFKEGRQHGRGVLIQANGMCNVVILGLGGLALTQCSTVPYRSHL